MKIVDEVLNIYLDEEKEMDGDHYVEFKDGEIDGNKKDKE